MPDQLYWAEGELVSTVFGAFCTCFATCILRRCRFAVGQSLAVLTAKVGAALAITAAHFLRPQPFDVAVCRQVIGARRVPSFGKSCASGSAITRRYYGICPGAVLDWAGCEMSPASYAIAIAAIIGLRRIFVRNGWITSNIELFEEDYGSA